LELCSGMSSMRQLETRQSSLVCRFNSIIETVQIGTPPTAHGVQLAAFHFRARTTLVVHHVASPPAAASGSRIAQLRGPGRRSEPPGEWLYRGRCGPLSAERAAVPSNAALPIIAIATPARTAT
jgi:hypothetical protein